MLSRGKGVMMMDSDGRVDRYGGDRRARRRAARRIEKQRWKGSARRSLAWVSDWDSENFWSFA